MKSHAEEISILGYLRETFCHFIAPNQLSRVVQNEKHLCDSESMRSLFQLRHNHVAHRTSWTFALEKMYATLT
jgi:hypothetical protein